MGENSFLFLQMAEFTQEKKKYLNASKNPVLGAFTDKKKSQCFGKHCFSLLALLPSQKEWLHRPIPRACLAGSRHASCLTSAIA